MYPFWSKTLYDKIDLKTAKEVMGVIPVIRKVTKEELELNNIFANPIPAGSWSADVKDYKTELGKFDLFGLVNKQLILWTFVKDMTFQMWKVIKTDINETYYYQGGWLAGQADGVGRTISTKYGLYEGQFVSGKPLGYGDVMDNNLHHYEGEVIMEDDYIVCNGRGTLHTGEKSIAGTWTKGYLTKADDKT